jgi:hypothetical protein
VVESFCSFFLVPGKSAVTCDNTLQGENTLDLWQFDHLLEFSQAGVQSQDDFNAPRECLRVNVQHLKSLSLELVDWEKADYFWFLD